MNNRTGIFKGKYTFYCNDDNKSEINYVYNLLFSKEKKILSFFNRTGMDNTNIFILSDSEQFNNYFNDKSFYKNNSLKKDAISNYDKNCLFVINKNNINCSNYDKLVEEDFIRLIENKLFRGTLPLWLSEGIVSIITNKYCDDDIPKIMNNIANHKLPKIQEISKTNFVNIRRNWFEIGYIMTRYLLEIFDKEEFLDLIRNVDRLKFIEDKIFKETLEFYNEQLSKTYQKKD